MIFKLCFLIILLDYVLCYENELRVGVIQKEDEETAEELFRKVLKKELQSSRPYIPFQTITEVVPKDDAWYYHRAVCRLLGQEVQVIVAPTSASTFPLLASYSNEFKFPFLSPSLPEAPEDPTAPDLVAKYGFGIQPSTTRASLDLIRYFGWQNIVYIYDDDFGPEKLQIMFRVAYSVLKLHLIGFLRATSAEDTVQYLRKLDLPSKLKIVPVILDTDSSLANEILVRFVHDVGVRKDKYHFLLIQPTLEDFWISHEAEFRAMKITGFLTVKPDFNRFNKVNEEWRKLFDFEGPFPNSTLKLSHYYYHDAAVFLGRSMKKLRFRTDTRYRNHTKKYPNCFQEHHIDSNFGYPRHISFLKETVVESGLTGRIEFDQWNEMQSKRKNYTLTIVQSTPTGSQEFGTWSAQSHGLKLNHKPVSDQPVSLQVIDNRLRVISILNAPYLMLKKGENASQLIGNDRFEGYCKDLMDNICAYLHFECELRLVEDNTYGIFDQRKGRWSGIIGDLIQGKADVGIADIDITGPRQRVVEFTDAYEMVGFSLVMKNPDAVASTSSSFYIFSAFSPAVWICILVAFTIFCALFHGITTFTGAPDSIESASGIWGRQNRIIVNVWFAVGSSMMQGTGVYPRSISSRILAGGWWFFTAIVSCLLIASITFQLQTQTAEGSNSYSYTQLKALSLESVLSECLENGWPKVGIIQSSNVVRFVKGTSLPLFKKYEAFLETNPSVIVKTRAEGIRRVRESDGGYVLLMESTKSDYESRQWPCDLVATHDPYTYAGYGLATPLQSPLRLKINEALSNITERGLLGHFHRKWWIESSQCKKGIQYTSFRGALHSFSGLFYLLLIGCIILAVVFGIQYMRKIQHREGRLQQLTFDDRALEHHLPDPPPELLEEPPPVDGATRL